MLAEKANGNMEFRYVIEMAQGSSQARNRGIKEANGQLLAFLDDDIELNANWLKNVYAVAKTQPQKLVYGARVIPDWFGGEENLPDWLNLEPPFEIIQSLFPAHDYGDQAKEYPFEIHVKENEESPDENPLKIEEELFNRTGNSFLNKLINMGKRKVQNPISACFLASKDIFETYGNFRGDLGIKANERGACEDTEFFWRILAAGIKVKYMPQICVHHPIPNTKIRKDFVLAWYELIGKTLYYMAENNLLHLNPGSKPSSGLILRIKLFAFWFFRIGNALLLDSTKSFWYACQIAKTKGELAGKYR